MELDLTLQDLVHLGVPNHWEQTSDSGSENLVVALGVPIEFHFSPAVQGRPAGPVRLGQSRGPRGHQPS